MEVAAAARLPGTPVCSQYSSTLILLTFSTAHPQRDGSVVPLTLPPWLALLGADLRRLSCPAPSREFPARRDSVPCYGLQGNQAQEYRNPTLFRPDCHGDGPRSREFPVSSLLIRESARETGSLATGSTANQSAVAETLHPLPATIPETPALSRGLGRGAQPNPNRRRRVPGR